MSFTPEQRAKAQATLERKRAEKRAAKAAETDPLRTRPDEIDLSLGRPRLEELPPLNLSRYGLPAETVERIRADARAKVEAEIRSRSEGEDRLRQRQLFDEELLEYRRAAGLANHLDDLIEITINCPPFTDKLVIDGVQYFQGYTYTVPRRVYNDMMKMMADGWMAEDRAGNPNRKYYRSPQQQQNPFALQRFLSDGSALHRATSFSATSGASFNTPIDNVIDEAAAAVSRG